MPQSLWPLFTARQMSWRTVLTLLTLVAPFSTSELVLIVRVPAHPSRLILGQPPLRDILELTLLDETMPVGAPCTPYIEVWMLPHNVSKALLAANVLSAFNTWTGKSEVPGDSVTGKASPARRLESIRWVKSEAKIRCGAITIQVERSALEGIRAHSTGTPRTWKPSVIQGGGGDLLLEAGQRS